MAKIPMGNFGTTVATPRQAARFTPGAFGAGEGQALAEIGQQGQQVALQQIAAQKRLDDEERDLKLSNEAMDAALRYEAATKEKARNLREAVRTGQVPAEAAQEMWTEELGRIREETVGKLTGSRFAAGAHRHAEQSRLQADEFVRGALVEADQQRFAAQAQSSLDSLGKLAVLPGEDLETVLAKADTVFPALAQRAGLQPAKAAQTLQDWKDRARFDRARLDLVAVRRDASGLDSFLKRLEDGGDLSGPLDPERRVALVKEAESARWQLQQSEQHAVDKREKVAERAVAGAVRQIEAVVPLSIEAWEDLRGKVAGTSLAPEFNRLVLQERETQQVLRQPLAQQEAFIQRREAELAQNGGTLVDKANLQRLKTALEANRKQLEEQPLLAAGRLFGRETKPLDLTDLLSPGGTARASGIFADRATTLQAMAKQFGARVGNRPLLPQEQEALTRALDLASPSEGAQLFGALRAAIDDDDTYRAAMQQIAPDSPVKARAGLLAAAGRSITLQDNVIADDVRISSAKAAQTVLAGEAILNRSKRQKAEDGKAGTLFAPPREAFQAVFAEKVGNLYRGRPGAQEGDLQTALAYYVGRSAELGNVAGGVVDDKLAKEAITATLGALVDFHGRGMVRAPLGMRADDLETRVREKFAEVVKAEGLPASVLGFFDHYGLTNYRRDGTFVLTLGDTPVVNPKTGQLIVLDLDPTPLSGSRYRPFIGGSAANTGIKPQEATR